MNSKLFPIAALLIAVGACNQAGPENDANGSLLVPNENEPAPNPPPPPPNPPAPAEANSAVSHTPPSLPEPKGPIDPKSAEAAGQLVQHYGVLLEQHRLAEAAKLWGDSKAAEAFVQQLNKPQVHLEIGDLGATEGAAGSIYTTVPVVFYGEGFRRPADVILRRVNDVPGSTEAQRRWHIERIELKGVD